MKRCPQCDRVETDDALTFCRIDGTPLVRESAVVGDIDATLRLSATTDAATAEQAARSTAPTAVLEKQLPATHTRKLTSSRKRSIIVVAAIVLVGALIVAAYFTLWRKNTSAIESIAVLPFQNKSTEPDTEYLSDGLAESLIYRLSQLPNLRVSPTSSVFAFKNKEIDPIRIGTQLGVSAVLLGRIVQRGDSLTISAELIDVRNNKVLWGEEYDRKMSDLLATQREIAHEIADSLKLKVSSEERGLAKHYTESNEAYQLYMKGRFYFNKRNEEGMKKALDNFQQAIQKDPNFALAYAGLADTYDLLGAPESGGSVAPNDVFPKGKEAALRAIEIDETLAEPHVSLAHVKYYYDRDWVSAEREFKRALALNPDYAQAHHWYAIYLVWAGRKDEGLSEIKRAQELDPLSLPVNMAVGWLLCDLDKTDEGIEQLRKTIEMDPTFVAAHQRLGGCYERKAMYQEALGEFQKILDLGPKAMGISGMAQVYAMSGNKPEALKLLAELQELAKQRYISSASIGLIYAALGERDQAFIWLNKAVDAHDLTVSRAKVDHRFYPLRSDPRFADLVKRVGLPQ